MTTSKTEQFDYYAYKSESVNNHIVKILIQAVGRICRTPNKNANVSVYVDEDIFKNVDFSVVFKNGRMLNPEFRKIAELNEKCNDVIGLGNNELVLTIKELPEEKYWEHVRDELVKAGLENVEVIPSEGIKIKLK